MKAGSIQLREDFLQSCILVLDGVLTSTTNLSSVMLDHAVDKPILFLFLPGRMLNLDITFKYEDIQPSITYTEVDYRADSWVASFSHNTVRELYETDVDFRHAVSRNMLLLSGDTAQLAALLRSNYTYYGLFHLMKVLAETKQYLTQQQIAELMNRDRTTISKALSRIKDENPELWESFIRNKRRLVSRPEPGGS